MNNTPRLRSAYPSSPRSGNKDGGSGNSSGAWADDLPVKSGSPSLSADPFIPLDILDAPSQRFYVSAFYIALTAWRLFDYYRLVSEQTDSLWLFMKWVAIDGVFLYGLPALKVPWLEWSPTSMTVLFLLHASMNAVLMFRIPIPLEAWLVALTKTLYDRELAVSERRVKPASLLRNSSLILGKQIIHILPEGSATLNSEQRPFCMNSREGTIFLPLRINQTIPILIELLRVDLDTNTNEIITIRSKEIKRLKRQAEKESGTKDASSPQVLRVPVKHTGLYRLQKVVDESNLEVQRQLSDTLVVPCPTASVKSVPKHKCMGRLSDFYLQVDATPPFKLKYSKVINREDQSNVLLNIVPENFNSPLVKQRMPGQLVKLDQGQQTDVSWARNQHMEIPVNETLGVIGGWRYSIDEVHDAFGNIANYTRNDETGYSRGHNIHHEQVFIVHEPPKIALSCNMETPLKVAKGEFITLPVHLSSTGTHRLDSNSNQYRISYTFTPEAEVTLKRNNVSVNTKEISIKDGSIGPRISEPGLYALISVSNEFCSGEIFQPSSCMLLNPPEPNLNIKSTKISDKCANSSIGLLLDLGLVGTPPFHVSYNIKREGKQSGSKETLESKVIKIDHMRTQLELKPSEEGQYTYEFLDIDDAVYPMRSIRDKNLIFHADVRPPASARFTDQNPKQLSCIQQSVAFYVIMSGEAPWTLEYEIAHGKKPDRRVIKNITDHRYELKTPKFTKGGEHLLSLLSVTDGLGCQVFLEQEAKVEVRHHKPEAAFGQLDGRWSIEALEGKTVSLPVRLTGDPPWTITYTHHESDHKALSTHTTLIKHANDVIKVGKPGIYIIKDVHDKSCPGSAGPESSQFRVSWLPRPSVQLADNSVVEVIGGKPYKRALCEEDQDALELSFTGISPFNLKYEVHGKPDHAPAFVSRKKETAGLNAASIRMDTSRSGLYEYKFLELDDQLYEHDRRTFEPLKILQTVYARPSASFVNARKTYSYCKEEAAGDEFIPVKLVGKPPFALEVGIRRHSTSRPEIVTIPHIETHNYNFQIPHLVLALGKHSVTIRKVQDGNGCQRVTEFDGPVVHVDVVDIPNISPLEAAVDFCVGDRISYTLSGTPPFNVFYTFAGADRKASVATTSFRRIAERPGDFTITGVSDKASTDACRSRINITKVIHELPSVRISKGRTAEVDIHEGSEAEILFEFGGTPPFEFTYTRSTNAAKGKSSVVLETKNEVSTEHSMSIKASEEGTYEVVSIRDRFCGFTSHRDERRSKQQLLTYK